MQSCAASTCSLIASDILNAVAHPHPLDQALASPASLEASQSARQLTPCRAGAEASAAQPPPANGAPSSPPASVSQQEVDSSRGQAWHEQGKDLGISPHSDAGFLTVLAQGEVPGLQVWHGQRWHTVQPIPGGSLTGLTPG